MGEGKLAKAIREVIIQQGPFFKFRPQGNGVKTMTTVKVTTVDNSVGIVLPKELLEHLRVGEGDTLHVTETPNGLELSPCNGELAEQMEVAEKVMRRDVLRKLAE